MLTGNLYRVVNDQLVPLLPHEVEQSLTGSGSQSPGLATLAAAAAAAGQRGGGPHGMAPEAGAAHTYTGVQAPLLSSYPGSHSLGGEMYVLNHAGGAPQWGASTQATHRTTCCTSRLATACRTQPTISRCTWMEWA